MQDNTAPQLRRTLLASRFAQAGEILVVFTAGVVVLLVAGQLGGESTLAHVASVWAANATMLLMIWIGLRVRGQDCAALGLSFRMVELRSVLQTILLSVVVFVVAIAAFVFGAVVMANMVGRPAGPELSTYNGLRGNLPLTMLALASVYFISAFGEEVIYRGFLINRIAALGSEGRLARRLAVALSAIVFGLVHSDWGLTGMVQASFMGLALGVSYLAVGRKLWVTILAHGYMDTILVLQMYFAPTPV